MMCWQYYDWFGNVCELKNVVECFCFGLDDGLVVLEVSQYFLVGWMMVVECIIIEEVLCVMEGNVVCVVDLFVVLCKMLYDKFNWYGIELDKFCSSQCSEDLLILWLFCGGQYVVVSSMVVMVQIVLVIVRGSICIWYSVVGKLVSVCSNIVSMMIINCCCCIVCYIISVSVNWISIVVMCLFIVLSVSYGDSCVSMVWMVLIMVLVLLVVRCDFSLLWLLVMLNIIIWVCDVVLISQVLMFV